MIRLPHWRPTPAHGKGRAFVAYQFVTRPRTDSLNATPADSGAADHAPVFPGPHISPGPPCCSPLLDR